MVDLTKSGGEYAYQLWAQTMRAVVGHRADTLAAPVSERTAYEFMGYVKA